MGDREVTFAIDRQGKPALLTKKESIAQQIINAIFLAPGNVPNLPIGLNVQDYLFKQASDIRSNEILQILRDACGSTFIDTNVASFDCSVVTMGGIPTFVMIIHLNIDDDEENVMGLVLRKQDDIVKFNYQFLSEGIKKAYGV